ncbi:MAG: TonB-dependent receptor plug domain-containing protein [Moheibacter sp.]
MKNIFTTVFLFQIIIALGQTEDVLELEEASIYTQRISTDLKKLDQNIVVIDRKEIEKSPSLTIEQLLSNQLSIDIRQRGVNGMQADVGIRGGSFEQTLVLINGTRMSDVQTGHHSLDIPINLNTIERIEIYKGPSARRFGQNAFTGAINIITKPKQKDRVNLMLTAGEFGTYGVNADVNIGNDKFQQIIQSDYSQSDGYRHNTDSERYNFWYQNKLELGKHNLNFQSGFIQKNFGANGFYATPTATEQYEETQSSLVNISADLNFNHLKIKPNLYWRRHQDEYIFVREDPSIYRNMHIGNTIGGEVNSTLTTPIGETGFGLETRKEYLSSNKLGKHDRDIYSVFLEHKLSFFNDQLNVTPGALFSHYSDFGSFLYPGLDLGYSINHHHQIFANIGQTYRTPTFTDLYYEDAANVGNPDLQPEEALSYELGYRLSIPHFTFMTSVFRRENRDLIDWVKENEDDKWMPQNLAEVNTNGFEVSIDYRFYEQFLNSVSVSYTYLDNQVEDSSKPYSRYSLGNLRHQLIAKLNHKIVKNLTIEWVYRYLDRVSLDDYQLLDARLNFDINRFKLFLQGNNLLNTNYTETNLIPMPGRYFSGGINYQIF